MVKGPYDRVRAVVPVPATAPERAQASQQLFERERLHEIVVGAAIQRADPVADPVARTDHQHRRVDPLAAQLPAHVEAVQSRQHQIQHDGIVVCGAGLIESGQAIFSEVDDMVIFAEALQHEPADGPIVFDQEQPHARGLPTLAGAVTRCRVLIGLSSSAATSKRGDGKDVRTLAGAPLRAGSGAGTAGSPARRTRFVRLPCHAPAPTSTAPPV